MWLLANDRALPDHLQFVLEKTLEFLLQTKREGEPAHITGLSALPKVNHTLEIVLGRFITSLSVFNAALITITKTF